MNRYRLIDGVLQPPPRCGVTSDGRAITNFRIRVLENATFAAENGYYPMSEHLSAEPAPKADHRTEVLWHLENGCWQCSYLQTPLDDSML